MPVEFPYLSSYKNVGILFDKIAAAKQPEAFTTRFLRDTLGLKSSSDRGLISLLKSLGFLDQSGKPTGAYGELKNPDQAASSIGRAVRRAYEPLFAANEAAHTMSSEQLRGLISQVAGSEQGMTTKIAGTFRALVKRATFDTSAASDEPSVSEEIDEISEAPQPHDGRIWPSGLRSEFHYNIQVHLPSNASEETYLSIFNALRRAFK